MSVAGSLGRHVTSRVPGAHETIAGSSTGWSASVNVHVDTPLAVFGWLDWLGESAVLLPMVVTTLPTMPLASEVNPWAPGFGTRGFALPQS